jgi:hypothetical protein
MKFIFFHLSDDLLKFILAFAQERLQGHGIRLHVELRSVWVVASAIYYIKFISGKEPFNIFS